MTLILRSAAIAALFTLPAAVSAQEYCVSCTEPNATYRCTISGARAGLSPSLQVACITALAKDGRHATCAVKRGVTVFECDGPVKTVAVGGEASAGSTDARPADVRPADVGSGAAVVPPPALPPVDPKAPPKTVLEAAQRAQKATDAEMRKAGDVTTGFFKRTFTCLGSLFTKCGAN